MELKTIILEECREEQARLAGYQSWTHLYDNRAMALFRHHKMKAHEKALDRLDAVYTWASASGFNWKPKENHWFPQCLTDAELLQLYKKKNP